MNKYAIIDTCYWFGLFKKGDQHHESAKVISELIEDFKIVVPYPTMYETLNSEFIKKERQLREFEDLMKSDRVIFIMDEDYRDKAIEETYSVHRKSIPKISLVDSIIREMLKDINLKLDYLVTFNEKDFVDVCSIRGVEILSE